ncbi:MAG: hypothetical protein JST80_10860 [Bdellovibrionales bacterium]|nr:hypothetical protein [Bdellovibrionales bacterium]
MKKQKPQWKIAREQWLDELNAAATTEQRKHVRELVQSELFNDFEIICRVFGWRCPTAAKVWSVDNKTGEKLGTHEAVEYLLRVVLGISLDEPTDPPFSKEIKKQIQDLVVLGYEKGHVVSSSSSIRDAARVAVNDTLKKIGVN